MSLYLDYNATTPVDHRVVEVILAYYKDFFGNPSSHSHHFGWEAQKGVESARQTIAEVIGAQNPQTIIFTSGATESSNLVLKSLFAQNRQNRPHIITQKTEHDSILQPCAYLETLGCDVTYLDVDEFGLVDSLQLKQAMRGSTVLVSLMMANNEIGTVQNIQELAQVTHEQKGVLFHTDAAQALGKIPIDVVKQGIDFMSFTAHKFYGPKGVGGLFVSSKVSKHGITPLLHGGGQEQGIRSGTLNVPGIIGLAKALTLCAEELATESKRQTQLRDFMIKEMQNKIDKVILNGHPQKRLPNNVNLSIDFVQASDLMAALPDIAFSSSSACASGSTKPSHVIMATTNDKKRANTAIRLSLGRFTKEQDVNMAIEQIVEAVANLRSQSLEYEMYLACRRTQLR